MFHYIICSVCHTSDSIISPDFRCIKVELFTPDKTGFNTQLNYALEEALKDLQPIALSNLTQALWSGTDSPKS